MAEDRPVTAGRNEASWSRSGADRHDSPEHRDSVVTRYWGGNGPLWKIFWLYGVLGSNILAGILLMLIEGGAVASIWFQLVLLLLAAYTVWIVVSVWRCAFNVEHEMYGYMARALTVAWAINAFFVLGFLELEFLQAAL